MIFPYKSVQILLHEFLNPVRILTAFFSIINNKKDDILASKSFVFSWVFPWGEFPEVDFQDGKSWAFIKPLTFAAKLILRICY
jgi:hypothetical protein